MEKVLKAHASLVDHEFWRRQGRLLTAKLEKALGSRLRAMIASSQT